MKICVPKMFVVSIWTGFSDWNFLVHKISIVFFFSFCSFHNNYHSLALSYLQSTSLQQTSLSDDSLADKKPQLFSPPWACGACGWRSHLLGWPRLVSCRQQSIRKMFSAEARVCNSKHLYHSFIGIEARQRLTSACWFENTLHFFFPER